MEKSYKMQQKINHLQWLRSQKTSNGAKRTKRKVKTQQELRQTKQSTNRRTRKYIDEHLFAKFKELRNTTDYVWRKKYLFNIKDFFSNFRTKWELNWVMNSTFFISFLSDQQLFQIKGSKYLKNWSLIEVFKNIKHMPLDWHSSKLRKIRIILDIENWLWK